tara:strand:- start:5574 stop:6455 length:882 start_codon:yes stop_codon:yes gene_type:complete
MSIGLKKVFIIIQRSTLLIAAFIVGSCASFQQPDIIVESNIWSGDIIYFVDLDDKYKQTRSFNRVWSKLGARSFRPYHKFKNKPHTIIGTYETFDKDFLIIEDQKSRRYKMEFSFDKGNMSSLPSYILFENIFRKARSMVGETIWLNNTYDPKGFYTFSDYSFPRFEPVTVVDVFKYQNNDFDHPIWLKVKTDSGAEAFLRYNGEEGRIGIQDHYYTSEPLPRSWGKKRIQTVLDQKIELGMTDRQLRISIGNPDEINTTSSRHGIGEQWIYKSRGSKIYYQFEYGRLTYINE